MKLIEYFASFLDNEVNLNDSRIALLDQRVESVTNFLKDHDTLKDPFVDTIPQGSYAHKTIIRPVQDSDEFDADLLLHLEEVEGWQPADYVQELYTVFRSSGVYRDLAHRRTRCVELDYANEFHLDVVPYLERHGAKYITNRVEDRYERTDPEAFTAWLEANNRTANGNLIKVIRLVKYLRDFKKTFSVKSFVLNTLLGERVNDAVLLADEDAYKDVPSTLRTVMNALSAYVEANEELPSIMDPSGTGENLSDRWDQDGYTVFRAKILYYTQKIEAAFTEPDKEKSLLLWQAIFGKGFKKPEQKVKALPRTAFTNTDQTLGGLGIDLALNSRYKVCIKGRVLRRPGFRTFDLSSTGNRVGIGRQIEFSIVECNIPQPYKIFWKVRNRGPEAERRDCIRGQIVEGGPTWKIRETTDFPGPHYVDCYIVRDGWCVARDRQRVHITAPVQRAS